MAFAGQRSRTVGAKGEWWQQPVDRRVGRLIESFWPWPELRLGIVVAVMAMLDYLSTVVVLGFGGARAREVGILASRALEAGGLFGLLLMDLMAVGLLVLTALGIRYLCLRRSSRGLARAAFIIMLVPYVAAAAGAVGNNIGNNIVLALL